MVSRLSGDAGSAPGWFTRNQQNMLLWINDALMAVFFLLVGLEVKRELMQGSLASLRQAAFPVIAAIGGMIVPALLYLAFNYADPITREGWAIPAATDIALHLVYWRCWEVVFR